MSLKESRRIVPILMTGVLVALAILLLVLQPTRAAGPWYVAPSGDDSNDCLSPATPCDTINGVLGKTGFTAGDTVLVSSGRYSGTSDEVVLLDKSVRLLGGWNNDFTVQTGISTVDGDESRRGITVNSGVTVIVEHFAVQHGFASDGGGIHNDGTLTMNQSTISENTANSEGGGIRSTGRLILIASRVNDNIGDSGGGILNESGQVTIDDSTVIDNAAGWRGGGLYSTGTVSLDNSTVSGNTSGFGGGILNGGTLALNNSVVFGNGTDSGIYNWGGNVILNNSTVNSNTGTGIYNLGTLALDNSTVSGNGPDGGIYNSGPAILNNSTISGNTASEGGGIYQYGDDLILQNTILAGNTASTGPDCNCYFGRSIGSAGYNLFGETSDCDFVPTTGDLLNIDGRLFPLIGSPGYHPLLTSSPAIDAGNPLGCTDHLGSPLETDQRGVPRFGRCDIGSYELDPANNPLKAVFLPCVTRNHCPDFFDDFGNPASGWDVVDDSFVSSEYRNGEYRILSKQAGYFYLFRAPTCNRQNYTVEVDARWAGTPGSGYGLIFGLSSDFSQYFLFDINTDYEKFRLLRRDTSGFTVVVPVTDAPAISGGTASNHLGVTRNGDQIILEVNGTVLGTWTDAAIGSLTGAGLASSPYGDSPVSDARFDNFSMASLPGSGSSAQGPSGVMAEEGGFAVPNTRHDPAPIELGW
jgi:hypothetical protein